MQLNVLYNVKLFIFCLQKFDDLDIFCILRSGNILKKINATPLYTKTTGLIDEKFIFTSIFKKLDILFFDGFVIYDTLLYGENFG